MRIDRFATLQIVKRIKGAHSSPSSARLPILMYHSVSDRCEEGTSAYFRLATPPKIFAAQMASITKAGCKGVSLKRGLELLASNLQPSFQPVAITFDDGFRDFYTDAWPVLEKEGFTATMYLPSGYISNDRLSLKGTECLTWSEVKELHNKGIEFGSHTVSHPKLHGLPRTQIAKELSVSKGTIEAQLGQPVDSFAFPYAFPQEDTQFTRLLAAELRASGYTNCVTTILGTSTGKDDFFRLKRLPVNSCDDSALLEAKLGGLYDWMGVPQKLFRTSNSLFKKLTGRNHKLVSR